MTPAKPASHAPRQNTTVKSCETLMPVTRAIAGSSTPARIIAPSRVRSSSAHSPPAKITAMTAMARRYVGKARLPTAVTPRSALGVATWMGSPVHTMRQTSEDEPLDDPAEHGDQQPAQDGGRPEVDPPREQARRQVRAQHEERAVGEVGNLHQAEDQREAGGEQKEKAAERDAVDAQHQPETHVPAASRSGEGSALSSSAGDSRASTRAARETTFRHTSRTGSPSERS